MLFFAHHKHAIEFFPYDSSTYWALAVDSWSLPASAFIRGYFFPSLLGEWVAALSAIGIAQVEAFRLFSSLVYSAALTLIGVLALLAYATFFAVTQNTLGQLGAVAAN